MMHVGPGSDPSSHSGEALVRVEGSSDRLIASLVMDRPDKRNALSPEMLSEFHEALTAASHGEARVVLIRSALEHVFCAGFDRTYLGTHQSVATAQLATLYTALEQCRKPVVAYADGEVVGAGNELFLSCDLRLATARTRFRIPAALLSIAYPDAGLARFVRLTGLSNALDMFLSGSSISAEEAQRCGLVTRIVSGSADVRAYCEQVAQGDPETLAEMKMTLRRIANRRTSSDPSRGGTN